jgi:histidinol phosphatase-like enzyme (inositol monophosphatase family)
MAKKTGLKAYADFGARLADASRAMIEGAMRQAFHTEAKTDGSPVTAVDRAVEERLREMIAKAYPNHGIVGEEHGESAPDAEYVWVLDPIDGTLPFLAAIPVFGTLIALAHDGVPVIGVIDMPATGERWTGCTGMATERNGEAVRARPCGDLSAALLSTSNPDLYGNDEYRTFERLKAAARWTVYGGSCLAYAQLASGRIDVGIDAGMDLFDYCALVPVIRGAGGVITDWQGAELTLRSGSQIVAAGDPRAHAQALEVLSGD